MTVLNIILIALTGFGTGIFGALLGIGGGSLIVPILAILFHVPMHFAIAASLLSVVATSSASASVFLRNRLTNIRLGMTLEMFTTFGGILGALIAVAVSEKILQFLFAGILLLTSLGMWRKPSENTKESQKQTGYLGSVFYDSKRKEEISYRVERLPLGFCISLLAGTISGLLGVGGGVIKVPTMVLGMKVPLRAASATSDMMIGVTAIASLYVYYAHQRLDLLVAAPAATGTFLGSLLGAHISTKVHSHVLTIIFSLILLFTAVEMALRGFGAFH